MAIPTAVVRPALVAAGFLLIATNLRPALSTVGPLLDDIRASTGMSAAMAGLLTGLPLLTFAVISPLAPRVARRFGVERTLMAAMVVLIAGLLLRSAGPVEVILAGTLVLGTAIAVGNVLLPGVVKESFPDRAGLMTALYTTSMTAVAALASGVSVPLADAAGLGWRGSLAAWAVLAALAAVVWWPVARRSRSVPVAGEISVPPRLRRSALAWQVTLFMGLQSLLFHTLNTWLPTLLVDDGMTEAGAGWMLGALQVASLVSTMGVPILATRRPSQRGFVLLSTALVLVGLVGLMTIGASAALVWVIPLGVGTGVSFALALTFLVLRGSDARITAALSGMSQSLGYLLAAAGPLLFGVLHDLTGSWSAPVVALLIVAGGVLASGLAAGRDLQVR